MLEKYDVSCSICKRSFAKTTRKEFYVYSIKAAGDRDIEICNLCVKRIARSVEMFSLAAKSSPGISPAAVSSKKKLEFSSPREIHAELARHVIGQYSYLESLSCIGYSILQRNAMLESGVPENELPPRENLLVIGPTGVGKTHAATVLCSTLGIPYVITDVTSLSEAGYVGGDVEDVLRLLVKNAGVDPLHFKRMCGLIFLDEIDKLAKISSYGHDVSGLGVQQALLKLLEGKDVDISPRRGYGRGDTTPMHTGNIFFIAAGAFSGLKSLTSDRQASNKIGFRNSSSEEERETISYRIAAEELVIEDLYSYGIIPELYARFHHQEILDPLSPEDLRAVLTDPVNSVVDIEVRRFEKEGIELVIEDNFLSKIASDAYDSRVGARGLKRLLSDQLFPLQFRYFGKNEVSRIVLHTDSNGSVKADIT